MFFFCNKAVLIAKSITISSCGCEQFSRPNKFSDVELSWWPLFLRICVVCAIYISAFKRHSDLSEISKVIDYSVSSQHSPFLSCQLSVSLFDVTVFVFITDQILPSRNYAPTILLGPSILSLTPRVELLSS